MEGITYVLFLKQHLSILGGLIWKKPRKIKHRSVPHSNSPHNEYVTKCYVEH